MKPKETKQYCVSIAVQLVDSFTNRPIALPMRVESSSEKSPIRKAEGYYIFVDFMGQELTLQISGHGYYPLCVTLPTRKKQETLRVHRLFLTPNEACSFAGRLTCIYGIAPAGATVQGCCYRDKRVKRLLADCPQGTEEVQILTQGEELEGRLLCALSTRNQVLDTLHLAYVLDEEQGRFALASPLQETLRKVCTKLVSLRETTADEQTGEYFLPLLVNQQGEEQFYLQMTAPNGKTTQQELTLGAGERRRWDWS